MVLTAQDTSLVGKLLDERYELLEIIGDGGVGVVYRARRVKLDRAVAVKLLQQSLIEDPNFVSRFQREAVAMSRLYHPHCVAVTDFGVYESRPYLVLEYVPGETVRKLVQQRRFDAPRAVHIALQLLETLEYFHRHHVIHRDLKSENVMLAESSGITDFVKVLDFGMAKILTGPGADSQISKIGIVPGTPSAMAPEQIRQLPPDPRIDIYATGILLYEMIVGQRPFSGPDMATVLKMQISAQPKSPRMLLGENALSEELERVVIKALEKDRFDRYATADEMAAALRLTPEGRAAGTAPLSYPPPTRDSAPAPRWRWPLRAAVGAAVVLGVALVSAQLWPSRAPVHEPPAAAAPLPAPPPPPVVAAPPKVVETWLAHRDLAAIYTTRGQHDDAFREVQTAIAENAGAAGVDPTLADAAAKALDRKRIAFVVEAFRANPRLVEALAEQTATGTTADQRHAAQEGLRALGQEPRADLVAMWILDVEQATHCGSMRTAFRQLRESEDPRAAKFKVNLRKRGPYDPHVRCLKRQLKH